MPRQRLAKAIEVARIVATIVLTVAAVAYVTEPAGAQEPEGAVVGMPPIEDAMAGWVDSWMDPDFCATQAARQWGTSSCRPRGSRP